MGLKAAYKQTDAGLIPADWQIKTLGALGSVTTGGTPSRANPKYWGGKVPWITTTEIDFRRIYESNQFISEQGLLESAAHLLPPGTLLLALYGQGKTRGKIAVLELEAATNQACAAISLDQSVCGSYVFHFLWSRYRAIRNLSNTGNQENLNTSLVRSIAILLPPKPEQVAIAGALGDADALIESLEQLLAKKRQIKQGAMQELLTGKKRLPGFTANWETWPFEEVLLRRNAKTHQIQTPDYQVAGRYPIVDQGKEHIVGFSDRADRLFSCPTGGVIVFGDHTCIVKFVDFDFLVGADGTQILVGRTGQSTHFHALELQQRGISPTGYNRHFKFLREREFMVPPLVEQMAITSVLSEMGAEIDALERTRAKARRIKRGMMQALLTGRIRLPFDRVGGAETARTH